MSVLRSDLRAAVIDLADQVRLEGDPATRFELIEYVTTLLSETLAPTSDKAIYDLRVSVDNIPQVAEMTGMKAYLVKRTIRRHCAAVGIPTPREQYDLRDYVPIL